MVLAIGATAATASEHATGEGLELETVLALAAGLLAMLAGSTGVARRRRGTSRPEGAQEAAGEG